MQQLFNYRQGKYNVFFSAWNDKEQSCFDAHNVVWSLKVACLTNGTFIRSYIIIMTMTDTLWRYIVHQLKVLT